MATRIEGERIYTDAVQFLTAPSLPAGSIDNAGIEAAAGIAASKVVHQFPLRHTQLDGADVVAATELVHIARGAGELLGVSVVCDAVPDGGDKSVSVDVQKSTGGAAFATMLDATIDVDSGETDLTPIDGVVVSSNTYAADDVLAFVVTVAGSTGTQAQGLCVTAWVRENPD